MVIWYNSPRTLWNFRVHFSSVAQLCPMDTYFPTDTTEQLNWPEMNCPILCDSMGLPGPSVHGISQARILEWIAISYPRGSSWARDQTQVSWIAGGFFTTESPEKNIYVQFICSVVSDSLKIHGLQSARLSCPSPTPEFAQIHVHQVGDAIQPSHPLSSLSPHAFNLSQLQVLSQWVSSSHQVAKLLEFQLQHQSFQWTFRTDFL